MHANFSTHHATLLKTYLYVRLSPAGLRTYLASRGGQMSGMLNVAKINEQQHIQCHCTIERSQHSRARYKANEIRSYYPDSKYENAAYHGLPV